MTLVGLVFSTDGVDLSKYELPASASSWSCLHNNGYRFAILQAQIGSSYVSSCIDGYNRAKAAGFNIVDFYIYPSTKTGASGVKDTISKLKSAGVLGSNTVWIDVEACGNWYGSNHSKNMQFVRDVTNAAISARGSRKYVGIYANWTQWEECFGSRSTFTDFHDLQLWYPHYDRSKTFSDFKSFGGWSRGNMKQIDGDTNICSVNGIDLDFY